ncbi:hypothetical protein [Motiliproteus sp.]|uniref:hypothetical protein n=1 Tax=Motiliproteus sp. TaxID=1898955 RepID=UPI003BAC3A09
MFRFISLAIGLLLTPVVSATEVASLTACKAEAEAWICASWKDNRMTVFRSEHYISALELSGQTESDSTLKSPATNAASGIRPLAEPPALAEGSYTLQLLACNAEPCRLRMSKLQQIPDSRVVEIRNDDQLWQVLLVGQFETIKAAQRQGGELITRYGLRDKPWVRSLESIRRRQVR